MNEAYLYNGAQGGGSPFHQPRKGHINARPKNLVIDPRTGARLGYRLRDGSFQKASSFMGKGSEYLKDSRAFRIAMAKADGSFDRKREAYNRAATDTEMDENGNILRKAKVTSSQTAVKPLADELPAQGTQAPTPPKMAPQTTPAPAAPNKPGETMLAARRQPSREANLDRSPLQTVPGQTQGVPGTDPRRRRPFPDEDSALA